MSNLSFGHLHLHTEHSPLDSLVKVPELAARCKELGMEACAMTDHGIISGAKRFYDAMVENGVKPILGCEFYVSQDIFNCASRPKEEKRFHITVLAKNVQGFHNIMAALNDAHEIGFLKRPRIDLNVLMEKCSSDVVIMSGCPMGMLSLEDFDDCKKVVKTLSDFYKDDFYLEVMPYDVDYQNKVNSRAKRLRGKYGKLVVTNDVHYLRKEDRETHEVVLAINTGQSWVNPKRWKFDCDGYYLKTRKEMRISMKECGFKKSEIIEAFESIHEIIEKCNIKLERIVPSLPNPFPHLKNQREEMEFLRTKTYSGAKAKGLNIKSKDVRKRLEKELGDIEESGFVRYFLIIYDLVAWARNNMLVGPGRGSVGGSLVSFCLDITQVNPLKYDLIWERFFSKGRIDLPDIDIDFQQNRRHLVIKYLENKYGSENVSNVAAYGHLKGRGAIRAVAKVFDVPLAEVDKAAKAILVRSSGDMRSEYSVEDSFNMFEECKKFKEKYPHVVKHAIRIEGLLKHDSSHAAGIVISTIPLRSGKQGVVLHQKEGSHVEKRISWDKKDLEFFGLCKIDALGLAHLSVISEVMERIGWTTKDLDKIIYGDFDDPRVYEMLSSAMTTGVFQLNTYHMKDFLSKMRPKNFEDMAAVNALVRPGTLRTGLANKYLRIRQGEEEPEYFNDIYYNITKNTISIMIYQEQIMFILNQLAKLPWRTTDTIRKAISKSQGAEAIRKFREEFLAGCRKTGLMEENNALEMFKKIETFGSYSFNKSHCVEYAILAYICCILKLDYPVEFLAALLNNQGDNEDKKIEFVDEIKRLEIPVEYPDINVSTDRWEAVDGRLYMPLREISNVGEKACQNIVSIRGDEKFKDRQDFENRINIKFLDKNGKEKTKKLVNKRVIESLEKANSLFNKGENPISVVESMFKFRLKFDDSVALRQWLERLPKRFKKEFSTLEEVAAQKVTKAQRLRKGRVVFPKKLVFGKVRDVRFALSDFVKEKGSDKGEWNKVAYFHMVDGQTFSLVSFTKDFYKANKEFCEGLTGRYIIAEVESFFDGKTGKYSNMAYNIYDITEMLDPSKPLSTPVPASIKNSIGKKRKKKLERLIQACSSCERLKGGSCMYARIPVPIELGEKNVLIITEAPIGNEDKTFKHLTGPAGSLFWREIERAGLEKEQFCITTVLKCKPEGNKITKKGPANICQKMWLNEEIKALNPCVIFSLGKAAAEALGNKTSLFQLNATAEWDNVRKCLIVYSVHPAFASRDLDNLKIFRKSIEALKNVLKRI